MLNDISNRNRARSRCRQAQEPGHVAGLAAHQAPELFRLGGFDSRVPAHVVARVDPGGGFVPCSVANIMHSPAMNLLSARNLREVNVCGQSLPLRRPRSAAHPPRRLHDSLQPRPPAEDARRPHTLRIHLQNLDIRGGSIHPRPDPPDAGTDQPGSSQRRSGRHALLSLGGKVGHQRGALRMPLPTRSTNRAATSQPRPGASGKTGFVSAASHGRWRQVPCAAPSVRTSRPGTWGGTSTSISPR